MLNTQTGSQQGQNPHKVPQKQRKYKVQTTKNPACTEFLDGFM